MLSLDDDDDDKCSWLPLSSTCLNILITKKHCGIFTGNMTGVFSDEIFFSFWRNIFDLKIQIVGKTEVCRSITFDTDKISLPYLVWYEWTA